MNGGWLLHHDNAPAHTPLVVRQFLTKKLQLFPTLPTNLTWTLRYLRVPWNDAPVERAAFRIHWRHPNKIATGTKHANAGRLQWVLPKMAKSLESLYTSSRWPLRRWRWKLGLKVSIHVITSKFSEILSSPSCCSHWRNVYKYVRQSALCPVSAARRATVARRNPWYAVYDISRNGLCYRLWLHADVSCWLLKVCGWLNDKHTCYIYWIVVV
jgi:hypothetical protein